MGSVWLIGVITGVLMMTSAQDISRLSPLFFPDGEMPAVHPYSASPPQTDQKSAQDSEWRLPRDVLPIRYNLVLNVDPKKETFSGDVRIFFYCVKETKKVTLHALHLDISRDFPKIFDVYDSTQVFEGLFSSDEEHESLTYSMDHSLQEGHSYYIDIEFKGRFTDEFKGLYRSNYTQEGETKWLAVTHFEPTNARRMFPCFDEPNMKAFFNVTVIHPRGFSALSNGPLQTKQDVEISTSKLTISSFKETVKMSTYLLAIVVSEYKNYSKDNSRANVWARPDIISGAKFSHELAVDALRRLENYTNIKFPMGKIDHVAVPHFAAGAMENYGLITYREPYLSLQENITKTPIKVYTVTVIPHELAHQWFGNLVTLDWWSYTWLNEAFATFFAYHLPREDKSWRLREQFIPAKLQAGMEVDQVFATSIPMSSNVDAPSDIRSKFDPISYAKGGSVLKMFQSLLGETLFQEAIRNYLIKRETNNAQPRDLFEEFEKVSKNSKMKLPKQVSWMSVGESWTSQAGLPLVTINRNYTTGEVTLTQSRFCSGEGAEKCSQESKWWIPVSWSFQGDQNKETENNSILWLPGDKSVVSVGFKPNVEEDRWILGNFKSIGYFRVNYDSRNWKLLCDDLRKNPSNIPTENRAQILHDALHFALKDENFVSQALNVTLFLQNEDDIIVWMTGVKVLRALYDAVGPTAAYDAFAEYAQKMLTKVYAKRGLESQRKLEGVEDGLIRAYVTPYACMFGLTDCLKDARLLINKILEGSSLDPDIETAVMCGGVQAGDEQLFWKVREKALESDEATNEALLAALACSKDDRRVKEHLRRVVSEESFPKHRIFPAIEYIIKSVRTFNVGFEFINENFLKISALLGENAMTSLLRTLCLQVRTSNQYQSVQTMLESKKYNIKDVQTLKKDLLSRSYTVDRNKKLARSISVWLGQETGKPVSPDEPGEGGDNDDLGGSTAVKPTIFIISLSIFLSLYR